MYRFSAVQDEVLCRCLINHFVVSKRFGSNGLVDQG